MATLFEKGMPGEKILSCMLGFLVHCLSGKHEMEEDKYNLKIESFPSSMCAPYHFRSQYRQVHCFMQTVLYLGNVANLDGSVLRAMKESVVGIPPNCKVELGLCIDKVWAALANGFEYRIGLDPNALRKK